MTPVRVGLLTEIPAPFRIPLFNALVAEGIDLRVLFLRKRNPKRPYPLYREEFRFRHEILPGFDVSPRGRWLVLNARVWKALRTAQPDVLVLGGWNQPAFWQALAFAKARRCPCVGWVESTERDVRAGWAPLEWAKRAFLNRCDAYVVPGRASAEYLSHLGIRARVVTAPNAVDQKIFGSGVADLRRDRERLRQRLGVSGCCVLFVGRLDPEKGVDVLIRALSHLADCLLVVIGEGAERQALEALSERVAPGRVRFLGFLSRDALIEWYAAADVFALPARSEQWGMTLNEAAAAGLPLVATEAAGAAHDLIEEGVNGFRVGTGDEEALASALDRLVSDPGFREAAGARSLERVQGFTPEVWGKAVASLVGSLNEHRSGSTPG